MLQVGVDDTDIASARQAEPGDHGGAQATLAVGSDADQTADPGILTGKIEQHLRGLVVTVVDETHLQRHPGQRRADAFPQGPDIARLVARGYDHADQWCLRSHRSRIGGGGKATARLAALQRHSDQKRDGAGVHR